MPAAKPLHTPFTRQAFTAAGAAQPTDADRLTDCARLQPADDPEVVHFTQFLPLVATPGFADSRPVFAPTAVFKIAREGPGLLASLKAARETLDIATKLTTAPTAGRRGGGARGTAERAPSGRRPANAMALREELRVRPMAMLDRRLESVVSTKAGAGRMAVAHWADGLSVRPERRPEGLSIVEAAAPAAGAAGDQLAARNAARAGTWSVLKALTEVKRAVDRKETPSWTLVVDYEQVWERLGYSRGRLLRSIPLTPGESIEVVIRSWDRRKSRTTNVTAIEEQQSTEVTGEERWSLAVAKETVNTSSSNINPSAGVGGGVTIPVEGVPVNADINLGITGSFSESLQQTVKRTQERTQQRTMKSAHSLKSTRSQTVELVQETGMETTTTQRISNPNACNSLTYHFFEVNERYSVRTRPVRIAPALLVTLKHPEWTEEQILCNECALRRMLPCEAYYQGFEAAKILLIAKKAGRSAESLREQLRQLRDKKDPGPASPLADLMGSIARAVDGMEKAPLIPLLSGDGPIDDIKRLWEDVKGAAQTVEDGVKKSMEQASDAGQHFGNAFTQAASGNLAGAANSVGQGLSSAANTVGTLLNTFIKFP